MINRRQKEVLLRLADTLDALRDVGMSVCADGEGQVSLCYYTDSDETPDGLQGVQIRELVAKLVPRGVH